VLLECATCTLIHMTKLAQGREIIRQLAAQRDLPQLLIRVGQAPAPVVEPVASPRRPGLESHG
jgi:hypothetical protein